MSTLSEDEERGLAEASAPGGAASDPGAPRGGPTASDATQSPSPDPPSTPRPPAARPELAGLVRWAGGLLGGPLALVVAALVAPFVPASSPAVAATVAVLAFACVCAEVLVTSALAPPLGKRALLALPLPVAVLASVAYADRALPDLAAAALVTAALLAAGTLVGGVIGRAIESAGHLVVVAIVSALVDIFSVVHPEGPTAQIVQIETAISVLLLPWPILGTSEIVPILGVGDITFAALYVASARQHGLSARRTLIALTAGFAATLVTVLVTNAGVPALPFLGAAMVVAHPEARRVPPKDRRKAAIGLAFIVVSFAALFVKRFA